MTPHVKRGQESDRRFLRLAIGIAMALGKLHERGLVHKDIKPVNILVNGATGDARLTGSTLHLASPASDRRAGLRGPRGAWQVGFVKELKAA